MSNTRYTVYRQSVIDFTKTLVIKSTLAAEAINNSLLELNQEVELSFPDTWKYYKNISGEYHFTDTPMEVISLDTLETIPFTVASLEIHRATAKGYAYGTRYYNELLNKHPTQELLIRGILYPVDIDVAIDAPDGTILYHDVLHIEENEYELMHRLQQGIYGFLNRWNVPDYRHSDDLYPAAVLAPLYGLIPGLILALRSSYCKTNQAHSYHIREYLASHGKIDEYMDILSKRQSLFLYRNINFINHNAGLQSTFNLLVEHLLTERNIPLSAYEMRHNTKEMPVEIKPTVELVQFPLNLQHVEGRDDILSVEQLLKKIKNSARDNANFFEEDIISTTDMMDSSGFNHLKTKVLESVVVDTTDDGPFIFAETLLNHWLYLACTNRYRAVVSFTSPVNGETIILSAKDSFTFYLYCFNRALGLEFPHIPKLEAIMVRRLPTPTLTDLKKIVSADLVPASFLQALLNDITPISTILSNEKFFDTVNAIHKRLLVHRLQYANVEHFEAHAMAKSAALNLYCDYPCVLSETADYDDWLVDKGLNVAQWSENDFSRVAGELLINATGVKNNNAKTLRDVQEGTVRLLAQLSSYTLNFVSTINTEPYRAIDWSQITLGDIGIREYAEEFWPIARILPLGIEGKPLMTGELEIGETVSLSEIDTTELIKITYDFNHEIQATLKSDGVLFIPMGSIGITSFESTLLPFIPPANDLGLLLDNSSLTGLENLLTIEVS